MNTRQVIHGISMGAATTMAVSGEKTPDYVKCFVEDCGYTSVWDEFSAQLKDQFGLPAFPLMNITSALCQYRYGWSFAEAQQIEQVARAPNRCSLSMAIRMLRALRHAASPLRGKDEGQKSYLHRQRLRSCYGISRPSRGIHPHRERLCIERGIGYSPICCPTTYPVVQAACRLKPPVMASMSSTSPAKKR